MTTTCGMVLSRERAALYFFFKGFFSNPSSTVTSFFARTWAHTVHMGRASSRLYKLVVVPQVAHGSYR